jgi:hypothetical protein
MPGAHLRHPGKCIPPEREHQAPAVRKRPPASANVMAYCPLLSML